MATPCEELGYKVGDKFKATESARNYFKTGEVIVLAEDDGSTMPLFRPKAGGPAYYLHIPQNVERIKPKSPWIEWEGGECPVPVGTLIDVKYRDGHKQKGCPAGHPPAEFTRNTIDWDHDDVDGDIVAYRLAKPKKAGPTVESPAVEGVQRDELGKPLGATVGDWFRVITETAGRPYKVGDVVKFVGDDKDAYPWVLLNGENQCIYWRKLVPCPAPTEPEPAKPEWGILWGSAKDFEGAPDWAVYATEGGHWAEDVVRGARLKWRNVLGEDTIKGLANFRPRAARRLKQPK